MVFLFKVWIPHYEKEVEAVQLLIYWIKGLQKARSLNSQCEEDYLSYKEEVIETLGLRPEYNTDEGNMFHSYELYQLGQTLFLYDKLSYNS